MTTDSGYIRRLTLLPLHPVQRILPGQTIVMVTVAPMGPRRIWRDDDGEYIHPLAWESMPHVITWASDEPHTVGDGLWTTRSHDGVTRWALVDDDGRRAPTWHRDGAGTWYRSDGLREIS